MDTFFWQDGKVAVADDILPDGYKINKGDILVYVPYSMGRMKYLWGTDADEFRPDRWLQNGVFQPESPFKFTAFQAGPRVCLGKDFAYMQMKIVAAALIRFFEFERIEGEEVTYSPALTLQMAGEGLNLQFKPRLDFWAQFHFINNRAAYSETLSQFLYLKASISHTVKILRKHWMKYV